MSVSVTTCVDTSGNFDCIPLHESAFKALQPWRNSCLVNLHICSAPNCHASTGNNHIGSLCNSYKWKYLKLWIRLASIVNLCKILQCPLIGYSLLLHLYIFHIKQLFLLLSRSEILRNKSYRTRLTTLKSSSDNH